MSVRQDDISPAIAIAASFHPPVATIVAGIATALQYFALAVMTELIAANHPIFSFGTLAKVNHALAVTVTSALAATVSDRTGNVLIDPHAAAAAAVHFDPGLPAHG
jgi:hypothetical protein